MYKFRRKTKVSDDTSPSDTFTREKSVLRSASRVSTVVNIRLA